MYYKRRQIWRDFLLKEEKDYKKELGYGREEIKKLGVDKFLNAVGWEKREDVAKWRTDFLKIIICPACESEFGVFNDSLGLCEECLTKYDMDKFYKEMEEVTAHAEELDKGKLMYQATALFILDPKLRSKYLKEESEVN